MVKPIGRIAEPKEIKQTRPICNNSVMTKIFTSVIKGQIRSYIENFGILSNFQSGFRSGHSCTTALMRVSEDIRLNIARNKLTILVLLDIKSAYASVSHELLMHALLCCGFREKAIEWIKCFLNGKTQYVCVNGERSNEFKIECGLAQGDNLSQTLFSIVINGVVAVIKNCKAHLYADDLGIYMEVDPNNINFAISKINSDLNAINEWIRV